MELLNNPVQLVTTIIALILFVLSIIDYIKTKKLKEEKESLKEEVFKEMRVKNEWLEKYKLKDKELNNKSAYIDIIEGYLSDEKHKVQKLEAELGQLQKSISEQVEQQKSPVIKKNETAYGNIESLPKAQKSRVSRKKN